MTDELMSRLMEELDKPWEEDVRGTIHALASLGQVVMMPLLRAIEEGNPDLGRHAALVLEQLNAREALPTLLGFIENGEIAQENRMSLINVMISLVEEGEESLDIVNFFLRMSHELDTDFRRLSAKGLGKIRTSDTLPALLRLKKDMVGWVAHEARFQLINFPENTPTLKQTISTDTMLAVANRLHLKKHSTDGIDVKNRHNGKLDSISQLVPMLRDAGSETLKEVMPILSQMENGKTSDPLMKVIFDTSKTPGHRIVALRALQEINSKSPILEELYTILCKDKAPILREAGLTGLYQHNVENLSTTLAESLNDPAPRVRKLAAKYLCDVILPCDKICLRPVLSALPLFEHERERVFLLKSLLQLLNGSTKLTMLLPEVQGYLDSKHEDELSVVLQLLDKMVPNKPLPTLSKYLLRLLRQKRSLPLVMKTLKLLLRVYPFHESENVALFASLLERYDFPDLFRSVFSLLGRIGSPSAISKILSYVHQKADDSNTLLIRNYATEILDSLEGSRFGVWKTVNDHYFYRPGIRCECQGHLSWIEAGKKQELRCETCTKEYVLDTNHTPMSVKHCVSSVCFCPGCIRKQILILSSQKEYICHQSGQVYSTHFETGQLFLHDDLLYGICHCCIPRQPNEMHGLSILCSKTSKCLDKSKM